MNVKISYVIFACLATCMAAQAADKKVTGKRKQIDHQKSITPTYQKKQPTLKKPQTAVIIRPQDGSEILLHVGPAENVTEFSSTKISTVSNTHQTTITFGSPVTFENMPSAMLEAYLKSLSIKS